MWRFSSAKNRVRCRLDRTITHFALVWYRTTHWYSQTIVSESKFTNLKSEISLSLVLWVKKDMLIYMSPGMKSYPWIYRLSHTSCEFYTFRWFFLHQLHHKFKLLVFSVFFSTFFHEQVQVSNFQNLFLVESLLPVSIAEIWCYQKSDLGNWVIA